MITNRLRSGRVAAVAGLAALALLATASPASGRTAHHAKTLTGTTVVTTAPGLAGVLLKAGVVPLPVLPRTAFRVGLDRGGLNVTYGFPIIGGNPNLAGPSGNIRHAGGIYFIGKGKQLEIGRFNIDLAAGKIFAAQVNFTAGRIAALDLDLSGLTVTTRGGATVVSGIVVKLDPAAAGALNATFGLGLPTDGSLVFGTARIVLR